MTIEDIILDHDRREISALRPHLPVDFCSRAARRILDNPGTALVVTGFYILDAGATETDGPPGAIVIGDALQALGYTVVYVTDRYTGPVMRGTIGTRAEVVDVPVIDVEASKQHCKELLDRYSPSILISIERCGVTDEGLYRNMRGRDISEFNAKLDYLFTSDTPSVGIGDGGNEIGMGKLASVIPSVASLPDHPTISSCEELVIASVSNWGGYGLVAALSEQSGKNLLPSIDEEQELLKKTVDMGAVDGMSAKQEYKVDGFTIEENSSIVARLHAYLTDKGVAA